MAYRKSGLEDIIQKAAEIINMVNELIPPVELDDQQRQLALLLTQQPALPILAGELQEKVWKVFPGVSWVRSVIPLLRGAGWRRARGVEGIFWIPPTFWIEHEQDWWEVTKRHRIPLSQAVGAQPAGYPAIPREVVGLPPLT